jgi:hypothetical protein
MPTSKAIKRQLVPPKDDVVFVIMIVVVDGLALQRAAQSKRQPEKGRMLLIHTYAASADRRSMSMYVCSSVPSVMSDIIISE